MEPDDGAGQISAGEFGAAFKGFLEQAVAQAPVEQPFFVRRLTEHFGEAPLVVAESQLDGALQELLFEGGELTRSLLGGHVSQGV